MRDDSTKLVMGVFLAIMIGWILVIGRPVILPIAASLIVAYIVLGLTELIGRLPLLGEIIPSPLRYALSILAIGATLFLLMSMIINNINEIIALAPRYQDQSLAVIQAAAERLGVETEPTWQTLREEVLGQINFQRAFGTAVASVSAIVATFALVLIYAGFMLMEKGAFAAKVTRLSSDPAKVARLHDVIRDVNSRIGTYLIMKTLINVLLACLSYVIMRVAGIEFAGFWAILIGLFNYVPYLGSFVGVFFPVALSVLQFGAVGPVLAIAAALTAAQMTVGNFVEPYLMGNSLNLSPLVILVSLVVWSTMWGVAGAILSVPIMAILVIVLSEFDGARPIAVMLSLDGKVAPHHAHAQAVQPAVPEPALDGRVASKPSSSGSNS